MCEGTATGLKTYLQCTVTVHFYVFFFFFQKDDPDDCPIELSKVQSVKAVPKKRRDRSLPKAFEIFTENKTYVFKAKDERNAEEWLQCINIAVAQAKERENREATTYL